MQSVSIVELVRRTSGFQPCPNDTSSYLSHTSFTPGMTESNGLTLYIEMYFQRTISEHFETPINSTLSDRYAMSNDRSIQIATVSN